MDERPTNEHNNPTKYKRRMGDRKEGRRIRSLDPIDYVLSFILPTRLDSVNYFSDSIDCKSIDSFCHAKREQGLEGYGLMHVLIAAYVRTVSQFPGINRFTSGYRVYARNNIEISMVVKKSMSLSAPESVVKFYFNRNDTVDDVYKNMKAAIDEYQSVPDEENDMDKLLRAVFVIPRTLLKGIVGLVNIFDYHGKIPLSVLKLSPFHASAFFTSTGSLRVNSVFHHLYNFGNIPMFYSFGSSRKENVIQNDGSVHKVKYLDLNITTEERICTGFYYAAAFHELKKLLKNPRLLDTPPKTVYYDQD